MLPRVDSSELCYVNGNFLKIFYACVLLITCLLVLASVNKYIYTHTYIYEKIFQKEIVEKNGACSKQTAKIFIWINMASDILKRSLIENVATK